MSAWIWHDNAFVKTEKSLNFYEIDVFHSTQLGGVGVVCQSSDQRVKSLQSNVEAERSAHLETKFNSEIIQVTHTHTHARTHARTHGRTHGRTVLYPDAFNELSFMNSFIFWANMNGAFFISPWTRSFWRFVKDALLSFTVRSSHTADCLQNLLFSQPETCEMWHSNF